MLWILASWKKSIGKCLKKGTASQVLTRAEVIIYNKKKNTNYSFYLPKFAFLHLFALWPEIDPQLFCSVRFQWPDTGLWICWLTFMSWLSLCPKWIFFLSRRFQIYRSEFFISTNIIGNSGYVIKGIWPWQTLISILQFIHKFYFMLFIQLFFEF